MLISCDNHKTFSVQPNNSKMRYLLFPSNNILNRALLVSGSEIFDNTISYYDDNDDLSTIPLKHLSWLPVNQNDISIYINNLNATIQKWNDKTDYKKIDFKTDHNTIKLYIYYKGGDFSIYKYKINNQSTPTDCEIMDSI